MSKVEKDHDTEESDFDADFKLEPLPCAADIIAELPDYPDSEEEEEVRNIMQMINVSNSNKSDDPKIDMENIGISEVMMSKNNTDPPKNLLTTGINSSGELYTTRNDKLNDEANKMISKNISSSENTFIDENFGESINNVEFHTDDTSYNDADEVNLNIDRSQLESSLIESNTSPVSETITDEDNEPKEQKKRPVSIPESGKNATEYHSNKSPTSNLVRKSKRQRIEAPKTSELKLDKKVYLNKAGEFFTGFDPASAEAKYRRQMRMQRFGKHEKIEKSTFDDSKLDISECHSDEKSGHMFEKRPEAIHLFGTDDLSTDDILEYFSEFSPHHIEWVDDSHCNVVWSDVNSVKRALAKLSKKYTEEELEEKKMELRRREKDEEDFYLVPGSLDRPGNDEYRGMWRLAVKDNEKAHLMFMRIAHTGDIKVRGAYKNSRYYSLYGNPNAPYLQNNDYTKLKQNQSKRQLDNKKTNMEMKAMTTTKPPDLRRYLKKGSIDVEQIKEEYKVGKPLIETLTIEVDRSETVTDVEVRKDNSDSGSEPGQLSESEVSDSRTVEKRQALVKRRGRGEVRQRKSPAAVIVHSSSSSDSSSGSGSESSSSSSSSSSDSSDSDSSDSSSDSSVTSEVNTKKSKKVSKKEATISKVNLKPKKRTDKNTGKSSKKVISKSVISLPPRRPLSSGKSVAAIKPSVKESERPGVRKLSSQIQPVLNNVSVARSGVEGVYRKKRRGRPPISPVSKRSRVQPTLDLRAKIASRSR